MKKFPFVFLVILFASCKKDPTGFVLGTVEQQGGCLQNSWVVSIENANSSTHSFICSSSGATGGYNCTNAIYITNLPSSLARQGKRIKFTQWEDNGGFCSSSSYSPHHLKVFDVSAR